MGYISHRHVKKQMAHQNEVIYRVLVKRLFSKVVKGEEKPEGPVQQGTSPLVEVKDETFTCMGIQICVKRDYGL